MENSQEISLGIHPKIPPVTTPESTLGISLEIPVKIPPGIDLEIPPKIPPGVPPEIPPGTCPEITCTYRLKFLQVTIG